MKLKDDRPNIESSGNLEEKFFAIQDPGMIFDILRNRMYSDPILAICREISCNARDAHVEVGTPELPIEITLPNGLEPFYKIKDYGPGISPDRMSNVFINYTASTKRNDNTQTGGFGLGAKTPFSYSDTFTISTVHDKTKYSYACFIDETKVGKLMLMGSETVDEPNSTEITVPIKREDFNKFFIGTEQSTRHWKVKPLIKGGHITWKEYVSMLSGTGWSVGITSQQKNSNSHNYSYGNSQVYDRGIKIIVDGIEYHVSMESLKKFTNTQIIDACKGYLFLYFEVGELSIAVTRESIYVDKATETKIIDRLNLVAKEINDSVKEKISAFTNYHDANAFFYRELKGTFNNLKFLGDLTWNNIKLHGPQVDIYGNPICQFYKAKTYRGKDPEALKIKMRSAHSLTLGKEEYIFYNDLDIKNPTYKHVKPAFEAGAETVQIIQNVNSVTYEGLNKQHSLTGIGCRMLSEITSATPQKNKAVSATKLLVFKITSGHYTANFTQVAYSDVEEDTSKTKVLCFFDRSDNVYGKQYKELYLNGSKTNHSDKLGIIFNVFSKDVSFYAIQKDTDPDRIKKDFPGFITLDEFVEKNIVNSDADFIGIKASIKMHAYLNFPEEKLNNLLKLISDQSPFFLKVKAFRGINELKEKRFIVDLYESLTKPITDIEVKAWLRAKPELDFVALEKKCNDIYPLLVHNDFYHTDIKHIAQYINFIDSI